MSDRKNPPKGAVSSREAATAAGATVSERRGASDGGTGFTGRPSWLRQARMAIVARLLDPFSFSTLAARIVALNVIALAVLVSAVLYLSQFRDGLIDLRVASLKTEADLIATTVAEASGEPRRLRYNRIIANEVLRRLALPTGLRAQLYDRSGRLTGDTRTLLGGDVIVEVGDLDDAGEYGSVLERIEDLYSRLVGLFQPPLEMYRETPPAGVSQDTEVYAALEGERAAAQRLNSENELILSVAVPVKRVKTVMGALVLSTEGGVIDEIVREERIAIIQVFLVAFGVTFVLSVVLAQTIARPIHDLASAAEDGGARDVSALELERVDIPDFTYRRDEIGHLSGALRRMTEALYSRMDAIEAFAADVAHEIKNPLTSLRSAIETLRIKRSPHDQEQLLHVLENDVRRLDRLVTDISNASRLDAELVREQRQVFPLARLLQNVGDIAAGQAEPKDVGVDVSGPDMSVKIRGMEHRLAQVLHNLLDNAVSFSEPGDRILMRASPYRLNGRPAVRIDVVDEGPGIPPDNLESIFQRFYSERPDAEEFGRHSGLGLSICRQIVEAHGGRIWAENRTDAHGARFSVVLPR